MADHAEPPPIDIVLTLGQRWKVVVFCTVLGAAAAVAYALLTPSWYSATLTVIPSMKSQDSAAMSLAAKLPIGLDSLSTDVQRIQVVLRSNSVADEVITRFNLMEHYEVSHIEHAREALWRHCGTSVDRKSNVVSLTCEDQDPERAKAMAAYFGEVGNKVFRRVSASSSAEERKFLETQVSKARKDVDEASERLRRFQQQHKVIDLPEQSKAVISAMASIQGELLSKQLELSYLSSFSARTESNVMQLQRQIAIMEGKLREMEASTRPQPPQTGSTGLAAKDGSFFPNAMTVPELRYELEQLMRDQKVKETVFFLMTQRYEMAKIDEARDTSTFQILDSPTLPTYRSRPKRTKVAVFGTAAGFAAGCLIVLLPAWWRRKQAAMA